MDDIHSASPLLACAGWFGSRLDRKAVVELSLERAGALAVAGLGVGCAISFGVTPAHADLDRFAATWAGTWHSGGGQGPAFVTLYDAYPIRGEIDIPGKCHATWTETGGTSDSSRIVAAHVTSGSCVDNVWNLTITPTAMTGVDKEHPGTSFEMSPSDGKPHQSCANSLPFDQLPPGLEEGATRTNAIPKGITAGAYGACAVGDAVTGSGGINNPGVFDGACKAGEGLLDPLNLGYAKNFLCGAPAG